MKNWKIILIVVIIIIIIAGLIYWNNKNKIINIIEVERLTVKCVPDCADDEVCVKGACVKKKIGQYD